MPTLQLIYRAVVIAKLTYRYASSSWWGFTSASDRQRLEAFLRRGRRYGLYPADIPTIEVRSPCRFTHRDINASGRQAAVAVSVRTY